jgi:hypothetical protein
MEPVVQSGDRTTLGGNIAFARWSWRFLAKINAVERTRPKSAGHEPSSIASTQARELVTPRKPVANVTGILLWA